MKTQLLIIAIAASFAAFVVAPVWADGAQPVDIKRAAPVDAHLAMYIRHNPERDDQRAYFAEAWTTFQDEHIAQRLIDIVSSRMPKDELAKAESIFQQLRTALEPIDFQALFNADEGVVIQAFRGPFNDTLVAVRLNSEAAPNCERGIVQAFELIARWTDGKVTVDTSRVQDATVTALTLPKESPYQPAAARLNDIVLISTDVGLLHQSVEQLQDESAKSKFDDPRLTEALTQLPKPEDSLLIFDGRRFFQSLRGIGDFIRSHSKNDEHASRAARFMDRIIDETAILDYEVTVEYTEPGQNHKVTLGKLADDFDGKLLGRVISQATPFENWQSWVPKDATAYSLSTGVSPHALYDGIMKIAQEEFPESQPGIDRFAELQEKIGVNLDRDILQSFSGESVSLTVPVKAADGSTRQESVMALKCQNPDKIHELLARAVDRLNDIPAVQTQQLKLEDCNDLAGFQQLHAAIFQMFDAEPVIGFRDGWMILASSPAAAEKLLAARAGQADAIDGTASFEKLGLDPKGPVYCVRYRDIGADVRQAANMIDKIGVMAPMFLGMVATKAKPEEIKPLQEVIGLLPSVAKVVRKFDFFEHNLSVVHAGPSPGTYLAHSVTEVRVPKGP